ncbi:MAG: MBL fold metallo-hydrolase [Candidatus Izemoplasma sp.]
MKVSVLASGSKGNCTYLETEKAKILIDAGISNLQINSRLKILELSADKLDGVLVTHEHTDHVSGLPVFLKRNGASCYLTKETYNSMYYKVKENISYDQLSFIVPGETFYIKDIEILPFSISHDASDAVGYILKTEGKKIVYVTDIGYLPQKDYEMLSNADLYIFESNYDVTKLFTSNRPFYLKQRIDSVKGHLSNNDAAYNLVKLIGDKTKQIILAHASRECNDKFVAVETFKEVFGEYDLKVEDYNLMVASQDVPTPLIKL